jgi:hypothetical protein
MQREPVREVVVLQQATGNEATEELLWTLKAFLLIAHLKYVCRNLFIWVDKSK